MSVIQVKLLLVCILWLVTLAAGFAWGRRYDQPKIVASTAHAEVRQADGSLLLARQPATLMPQQLIPHGDRVVNVVRLQVAPQPIVTTASPTASESHTSTPETPQCRCDPLTVDLSLVKDSTGLEDVLASSPDGRIVSGISSPLLPSLILPEHPWAVGFSHGVGWGTNGNSWGLSAERNLGAWVIGADLYANNGIPEGRVRLMFRF